MHRGIHLIQTLNSTCFCHAWNLKSTKLNLHFKLTIEISQEISTCLYNHIVPIVSTNAYLHKEFLCLYMIQITLGRRSHSRKIFMCLLMLESPTLQLDGLHTHVQQFQGMEVLLLLSDVEFATTQSILGMSSALGFFWFSRNWVNCKNWVMSEVMLSIWEVSLPNEIVLSTAFSITILKFVFSKANSDSCNSYGEWEWIYGCHPPINMKDGFKTQNMQVKFKNQGMILQRTNLNPYSISYKVNTFE